MIDHKKTPNDIITMGHDSSQEPQQIETGWRALLWVGVIILCFWILLGVSSHANASIDQLYEQKEQLQQNQKQLSVEQERLKTLEKLAENRLKGLQSSLKTTDRELQDLKRQIDQTTQNLKFLNTQRRQKKQEYQEIARAAIARFRLLQRHPRPSGWAILLQSQSLTDFLSRRHRLQQLALADRQLLLKVKTAFEQSQQQALVVEREYNQLLLMNQHLIYQKQDYQNQSQVQGQLIKRLNQDRRALEAAYAQLQEDSHNLEYLIRDRIATSSVSLRNLLKLKPGKMLAPSHAPLSSTFGWRTHPIFGYERFHGGLDFAADYGSPIYAAQTGLVIFAGWYGGYGNTVILDHGNGITTLYGHTDLIYVQEGESVNQGDPMATTGSTGLSTGPHLHFEVRENGTPVDPMDYLA